MTPTRTLALTIAGLVAMTAAHGRAQNPVQPPPNLPNEAQVMQVKLKRAQTLLEALAKEDFKVIGESAQSLVNISKATEFLRAYKSEDYEFQARVFQKSAENLVAKAKEKNLDGATLAYMDMTLSCVACHSTFRGKKRD